MTKKLKTIIIDDEHNAVEFISSVIADHCPELEIVGKAYNVDEGIRKIEELKPDLVFLDVENDHTLQLSTAQSRLVLNLQSVWAEQS